MSRIPSIEVNGFEPWMSQVISSNTVRNALIVTNRTPLSISRRASRQHWPNRVMPYRSRVAVDSWDRSNASRACGLVISRNADWKLPSSSAAFSVASNVVDGVVDQLADLAAAVEPDACRSPWAAAGRAPGSRASTGRR